jgi:antitoxin HicB
MPNSNGLNTGIGILAAVARQERVRLSERTIAGLQPCQGPGTSWRAPRDRAWSPDDGQSRSSATEWRFDQADLQEEGVLEEIRAIAIKEVVAWQIEQAMLKGNITKVEMAKRMRNSRAALNRLLGPANDAVTLPTLWRAAHAIGRELHIELV